jgi:hypothetical protein
MMAQAYASVVESRPFRQEEVAGALIVSGVIVSTDGASPVALISTAADTFMLAASGRDARQRLQEALGTLRNVGPADAAGAPARIRIRTVAHGGDFARVARQTCGSVHPVEKLAELHGVGTPVAAGERIKCVEPGSR